MVELTGMFAGDLTALMLDLHQGIDVGKRIVTATHNFEIKLMALDNIFMMVQEDYWHEDLGQFFVEVSDLIVQLRDELEVLSKGDLHFILEEEAAEKKGKAWILKHRKLIEDELKGEAEVNKKVLDLVHLGLINLKEKFAQVAHLFSVEIELATVKEIKLELEGVEEEVKHILEQLMGFFVAYEHIFREATN